MKPSPAFKLPLYDTHGINVCDSDGIFSSACIFVRRSERFIL